MNRSELVSVASRERKGVMDELIETFGDEFSSVEMSLLASFWDGVERAMRDFPEGEKPYLFIRLGLGKGLPAATAINSLGVFVSEWIIRTLGRYDLNADINYEHGGCEVYSGSVRMLMFDIGLEETYHFTHPEFSGASASSGDGADSHDTKYGEYAALKYVIQVAKEMGRSRKTIEVYQQRLKDARAAGLRFKS